MRRLVVLAAVCLVATIAGSAPARAEPVRILVYGDSLSFEARPYIERLTSDIAGVQAVVRSQPGGATCDLFDEMARDARTLRPEFVVIQFSGNTLTPCVQGLTGEAFLAKYRADTFRAVELLKPMGAPIHLASSPISLLSDKRGEFEAHALAAMHRQVAAQRGGVHAVDAAQAVLDQGRWTPTLPCLPKEPCTGVVDVNMHRVNRVRSTDGAHFCPLPYREGAECQTWSAGAHRYALGMILPGIYAAGLFDVSRYERSTGAGFG